MGRAYATPILDIMMYQGEFAGCEVKELTTNVIAESINAQCDTDGNEHLLLNLLVDHRKENKVISLTDQETCIWGRPVSIHCRLANLLPVDK